MECLLGSVARGCLSGYSPVNLHGPSWAFECLREFSAFAYIARTCVHKTSQNTTKPCYITNLKDLNVCVLFIDVIVVYVCLYIVFFLMLALDAFVQEEHHFINYVPFLWVWASERGLLLDNHPPHQQAMIEKECLWKFRIGSRSLRLTPI